MDLKKINVFITTKNNEYCHLYENGEFISYLRVNKVKWFRINKNTQQNAMIKNIKKIAYLEKQYQEYKEKIALKSAISLYENILSLIPDYVFYIKKILCFYYLY